MSVHELPDSGFNPSVASEQEVADTIVSARKSWKTVKGKSEPVWPPHLEKALVKALLQYKPNDSRYARALGRFPKRNRFISDFIFEETGTRRSPKQVGSRLQQLKDVNCGKQLLNHVASQSLGTSHHVSFHASNTDMADLGFSAHHFKHDGSASPPSPFSHVSPSLGLNGDSLPSPLSSSFYSPGSSYGSLPVTPHIHSLEAFVSYNPAFPLSLSQRNSSNNGASPYSRPLKRFSGCLTRPESIFALDRPTDARTLAELDPAVVFLSREPVAAQSVVVVWADSDQSAQGRFDGASRAQSCSPTPTQVHRENHPLVCTRMPAVMSSASGMQSPYNSSDEDNSIGMGRETRIEQEYFVYGVRLFGEQFWDKLCQEIVSGKTYRIKQDLICNLDNSAARRGEVLLSITYHFVPIKSGAPDSRQQASLRGSASPSSSSSASTPLSASPGSSMHASLQPHQPHALTHGGQMQMQLPMHAQASVMRGIAQPPMRSSMAPQSMTIGRELTPADMNMTAKHAMARGSILPLTHAGGVAQMGYPMVASGIASPIPNTGSYQSLRTGMTPAPFDLTVDYDNDMYLGSNVQDIHLGTASADAQLSLLL